MHDFLRATLLAIQSRRSLRLTRVTLTGELDEHRGGAPDTHISTSAPNSDGLTVQS